MNDTTKTLHVTIGGTVAAGKTTFAQAIENLCKQHGIEVIVNDGLDGDYDRKKDLSNLADKVTVVITTKQLHRTSL